jgi:hypothetical protein
VFALESKSRVENDDSSALLLLDFVSSIALPFCLREFRPEAFFSSSRVEDRVMAQKRIRGLLHAAVS